jgi:hypothetical protein
LPILLLDQGQLATWNRKQNVSEKTQKSYGVTVVERLIAASMFAGVIVFMD